MRPSRFTSFEHVLLGMISLAPSTGYDLKREFATTATGVYQPSSGALYPALDRLERRGLLRREDLRPARGGRLRRLYHITVLTTAPLQVGNTSAWWYAQDSARALTLQADGQQETIVPIRSGQQQGFVVTVYNPGNWTQTVLGWATGMIGPGGPGTQVGVAGPNLDIERGGGDFQPLSYRTAGSIPPHQTRALRVLWTSTTCLEKGGTQITEQLTVRVRIGLFTRTEVIPLGRGWALAGPSHGACT